MTEKASTHHQIAVAAWPQDLEAARSLLLEYRQYLAASPAAMCLPGYDAELASMPANYQRVGAVLLLARVQEARVKGEGVQGDSAGCVAIFRRVLAEGVEAAEMKRLWVPPRFRGLGLGRGLVNAAIEWAAAQRCRAVVLDTVVEAMPEASQLYRSLGFVEVARFNDNPVPGVRFYQLTLEQGPPPIR